MKNGNNSLFYTEIMGKELAIQTDGLSPYLPPLLQYLETGEIKATDLDPPKLELFTEDKALFDNDGESNSDSLVAIITIRGFMSKYGCWWCYGAEDYANMLDEAYQDDRIKAVVLQIDSPGGAVNAAFPLEAAIKRRNKPVIAAVDSNSFSCAYYTACLTDQIIAVNRMAQVGSIGVMTIIVDDRKMLKDWGVKFIEIYPPESKWKNKPQKEALNGKPELIIKEQLSPWAQHFQNIVKEFRPGLNTETEGILEGRVFYAYDAIENGLVDKILTFDEIIDFAFNYEFNKKIKQIINS